MALQGYKARVKAQSSEVAFTGEATTTSDNITYQITNTAKRIWDYATAVVVNDDGTPTTEAYVLNRLEGTVTFESADAGRVITLDGAYVALTTVAEAKEVTLDGSADMGDTTVFEDESRSYIPLLISAVISLGKFYTTDNYYPDALQAKEVVVVEIYPDASDDGVYRFFASVSANGIGSAVDGLVEETVTLQCTNEMLASA